MDSLPITCRTVLLGAADLIRKRGWTKFTMQTDGGALCLRGAIRRFLAEGPVMDCVENQNAIDDAEKALNRHIIAHEASYLACELRPGEVITAPWNDLVCQSQDHAIRVLEAAALGAE